MKARKRERDENIVALIWKCYLVALVLFGIVPLVTIMLIGIFTGTTPLSADGGSYGVDPDYPAFDPQRWLLLIPALRMLFLAVWTIPFPLHNFGVSRIIIAFYAFAGGSMTLVFSSMFYESSEGYPSYAALWASGISLVALALFVLRMILSALHLLPRSRRGVDDAPSSKRSKRPQRARQKVVDKLPDGDNRD